MHLSGNRVERRLTVIKIAFIGSFLEGGFLPPPIKG